MQTSVTGIEDASGCLRRWWFGPVQKLVEFETTKSKVFGDILHSVCDRYLSADARGCGKDGKPIDLYPDRWEYVKDRWTGKETGEYISAGEQALVKTLIHAAIREGYLIRTEGREIEKEYKLEITQGLCEGVKATIKGYKDVEEPARIIDHKTIGNVAYAKTAEGLKSNIQMVLYALDYFVNNPQAKDVILAHNQFITNAKQQTKSPEVRQIETTITQKETLTFYKEKILPVLAEMSKIYAQYPKKTKGKDCPDIETLKKFTEIPATTDVKNNCQYHYGKPCPFADVCNGSMSMETFISIKNNQNNNNIGEPVMSTNVLLNLINNNNKKADTPATTQPQQETTTTATPVVSQGFDLLGKAGLGSAPKTEPTVKNAVEPPVATVQTNNAIQAEVVPWHFEGCMACANNTHKGFTVSGEPCMSCLTVSALKGKPKYEEYKVDVMPNGDIKYTSPTGEYYIKTAEAVKAKKEDKTFDTANTGHKASEGFPAFNVSLVDVREINGTTAGVPLNEHIKQEIKESMNVAKMGGVVVNALADKEVKDDHTLPLVMAVGCTVVLGKSKPQTVDASEFLNEILSHKGNLESHFDLKAFVEKSVTASIEDIRSYAQGRIIVSQLPEKGSLLKAFVDTLTPLCDYVIGRFDV